MHHPDAPRDDRPRPTRTRAVRPKLESLEDRQLLSTTNGGQWTYGSRITYSFMPDGTSIGGTPSNLFQALGAVAPTATWQLQFEKAAAVWEAVANINLSLVPDDGTPLGSTGYQQGDPRFGDIRIGAYPQGSGTLAYALSPPPVNGGSDAGDVVLNSAMSWHVNNDYDLETVAIHEIGHALGMGHSAIASAVMYAFYTNIKQGLTGDDISGIQALYGPVPSPNGYTSASAALDLTPMVNSQAQVTLNSQYISSATDYEWYKVTVPATTTGTLAVVMQSGSLSSLSPRVAVFNGALGSLGQSVLPNSYGSTASFSVAGVLPGQVYYVRCSAANTGASAVGGFALQVNLGPYALPAIAPPDTQVASQLNQGTSAMYDTTRLAAIVAGLGQDLPVLLRVGSGLTAWGDPLQAGGVSSHHPRGPRAGHGHRGHHRAAGHATDTAPAWQGSTIVVGASHSAGAAAAPGTVVGPGPEVMGAFDHALAAWDHGPKPDRRGVRVPRHGSPR